MYERTKEILNALHDCDEIVVDQSETARLAWGDLISDKEAPETEVLVLYTPENNYTFTLQALEEATSVGQGRFEAVDTSGTKRRISLWRTIYYPFDL